MTPKERLVNVLFTVDYTAFARPIIDWLASPSQKDRIEAKLDGKVGKVHASEVRA